MNDFGIMATVHCVTNIIASYKSFSKFVRECKAA
jgi:hypothetical protein